MTNREKLQETFPNIIFIGTVMLYKSTESYQVLASGINYNWLNAEYEIPTNSTTKKDCNTCTHNNETDGSNCYECVKGMCNNYEPTTKNDVGVDCISRADAIRVASGYCHPSNVAKELAKLPSVTPQEPRWIPVKTRKLTDAEELDMLENSNYYFNSMFDCPLPEDGEEVLITTSTGEVTTTIFCNEGLDGCYFEFYEDDGDVIAWMSKPNRYKVESEG